MDAVKTARAERAEVLEQLSHREQENEPTSDLDRQAFQIAASFLAQPKSVTLESFWRSTEVSLRDLGDSSSNIGEIRWRFLQQVEIAERDAEEALAPHQSRENGFYGVDTFNELDLDSVAEEAFRAKVMRFARERLRSSSESRVLTFSHDLKQLLPSTSSNSGLIGTVQLDGEVFFVMRRPSLQSNGGVARKPTSGNGGGVYRNLDHLVQQRPDLRSHVDTLRDMQMHLGGGTDLTPEQEIFRNAVDETYANIQKFLEIQYKLAGKLNYKQIQFERVFAHYLYKFDSAFILMLKAQYEKRVGEIARDVMITIKRPKATPAIVQGLFDILPPPRVKLIDQHALFTPAHLAKALLEELLCLNRSSKKLPISPEDLLQVMKTRLTGLKADPKVCVSICDIFRPHLAYLPRIGECVPAVASKAVCEEIVDKVQVRSHYMAGLFLCRGVVLERRTFEEVMTEGFEAIAARNNVEISDGRACTVIIKGFEDAMLKSFPSHSEEMQKTTADRLSAEAGNLRTRLAAGESLLRQVRAGDLTDEEFAQMYRDLACGTVDGGELKFVGKDQFSGSDDLSYSNFGLSLVLCEARLWKRGIVYPDQMMLRQMKQFLNYLGVERKQIEESEGAYCRIRRHLSPPASAGVQSGKAAHLSILHFLLEQSAISLELVARRVAKRLPHEEITGTSAAELLARFEIPGFKVDQVETLGKKLIGIITKSRHVCAFPTPEGFGTSLFVSEMELRQNNIFLTPGKLKDGVKSYLARIHASRRYIGDILSQYDRLLETEDHPPFKRGEFSSEPIMDEIVNILLNDLCIKAPYVTGLQLVEVGIMRYGHSPQKLKAMGVRAMLQQHGMVKTPPNVVALINQGFSDAIKSRLSSGKIKHQKVYTEVDIFRDDSSRLEQMKKRREKKRLKQKKVGSAAVDLKSVGDDWDLDTAFSAFTVKSTPATKDEDAGDKTVKKLSKSARKRATKQKRREKAQAAQREKEEAEKQKRQNKIAARAEARAARKKFATEQVANEKARKAKVRDQSEANRLRKLEAREERKEKRIRDKKARDFAEQVKAIRDARDARLKKYKKERAAQLAKETKARGVS